MKPLVSILIPAYNAEPWIAYAINSALRQTWSRKEIIVVDDGSTDGTRSVANKFSKDGVDVLVQENRGASAARNHAFSLCDGDYIQWLDADDVLAPDKISRQMAFAETSRNKRLLLSSEWGKFLYRTGSAQFLRTDLWQDLSPLDWLLRKMSQNIWMQPGSWLVSRELTEAAGPWDERLSFDDDGEYFCRVLLKSEGVKFIPNARTFYRTTPGSLSDFDRSNKKLESAWLSIRLHIHYLRQLEDSPRTRQAAVIYLQTWLPSFHPYRPDIVYEVHELAAALGGHVGLLRVLEPLRWKFAWMKSIFGRRAAYWAQTWMPRFKHSALRHWEKTIFQLEKLAQP
jgi:glycosyltransferase involved in cell wall biosynthesis